MPHCRLMSFLPPFIYVIAISFLVSLIVFFKTGIPYAFLRFFTPFLLVTLIAEITAYYMMSMRKPNIFIYNFFSTFEICFYLLIISHIISNRRVRKITRVTIGVYALLAISNILFIQKIMTFHTITYSLGCLLVVIFCIYYFYELFRLPKSGKLVNNPAFWICSGLLFFYCCGFPLFAAINFWSAGISRPVLYSLGKIVIILNIFLYSLFIIAFLCARTPKYTLSSS